MKKFLSNSLSGVAAGVGVALGEGEVPTAGAVIVDVVVAGDMEVVAGDIPGIVAVAPGAAGAAGLVPGAVTGAVVGAIMGAVAGLMAVVGGGPGGLLAGDVGGGWPNEVSARVTEMKLAISSVFIG
jgi:hypothetical protein